MAPAFAGVTRSPLRDWYSATGRFAALRTEEGAQKRIVEPRRSSSGDTHAPEVEHVPRAVRADDVAAAAAVVAPEDRRERLAAERAGLGVRIGFPCRGLHRQDTGMRGRTDRHHHPDDAPRQPSGIWHRAQRRRASGPGLMRKACAGRYTVRKAGANVFCNSKQQNVDTHVTHNRYDCVV